MRFPKISLVICTLVLAATVRAEDTPAQAAARAALAAKLFELSAQTPDTNSPTNTTPPAAAPETVAAPAAEPATNIDWDAAARAKAKTDRAAEAANQPEVDKALAELRAKRMAERQDSENQMAGQGETPAAAEKPVKAEPEPAAVAAEPAAPTMTPVTEAPAQPAAESTAAAPATEAAVVSGNTVELNNTDTPAQAKAREAMVRALFEMSAQSSQPAPQKPAEPATEPAAPAPAPAPVEAATPPAPAPAPVAPAPAVAPTPAPAPAPLVMSGAKPAPGSAASFSEGYVPPPLPFTAEQQQQLADLLTKYKADLVTPEEYQKQRAAILAK